MPPKCALARLPAVYLIAALVTWWCCCCCCSSEASPPGEVADAPEVQVPDPPPSCGNLLQEFLKWNTKEPAPFTGTNMVYFLHIPRTAGRTFHSCLLRPAFPGSKRCPKSYDHLRIDMSLPKCFLLSSHDDFSVVEMLPEDVAVISQIRDPVDRVISAYEFAIEVAARQVDRPKGKPKPVDKTITDDVWPWSHLIPFFLEDIRQKAAHVPQLPNDPEGRWFRVKHPDGDQYYHNKLWGESKWNLTDDEAEKLLPPLNPYNNSLVMPLHEFIEHPLTRELLHDGAFLQVLGLTNYSQWKIAPAMRKCAIGDPDIRRPLLAFADSRVRRFSHVGITDMLEESVTSCSASLSFPLEGPSYGSGENNKVNVEVLEEKKSGLPNKRVQDLAADVRKTRELLRKTREIWNMAVDLDARDDDLTKVRMQMNALRLELIQGEEKIIEARKELKARDEHTGDKRLKTNLGTAYQSCQNKAQNKNKVRKEGSLRKLRLPDGRGLEFSRKTRSQIAHHVIERIRELNAEDVHLYNLAKTLLVAKRQEHEANGSLQQLPSMSLLVPSPAPAAAPFDIPKPPHPITS